MTPLPPALLPPSINERLRQGEIVEIGGKMFVLCQDCKGIVRMDKPIFGSLHRCVK